MRIRLLPHFEAKVPDSGADIAGSGAWFRPLTERGLRQAYAMGQSLGRIAFLHCMFLVSPQLRAKQSAIAMLAGAGLCEQDVKLVEDWCLREMYFGTGDISAQEAQRPIRGRLVYQFEGGESVAQVFDRLHSFPASVIERAEREGTRDVVCWVHGVVIRVVVARFLDLSMDQYNLLCNNLPGEVVTLDRPEKLSAPQFVRQDGSLGVEGLRFFKPLPEGVTLPILAGFHDKWSAIIPNLESLGIGAASDGEP